MKPHLKRIEATLHRLGTISTASYPQPTALRNRTYSFEIPNAAQKRNASEQTLGEGTLLTSNLSVQKFPAQQSSGKAPTLPKFKSPKFNSHRQVTKPALAIKPLKEIQTDAATCKLELQQILRQIQDIYLQGPLVDGWLESHPRAPEPGTMLQHPEEVTRLVDYVEEVCSFEQGITCESPRAGYRLCGRDTSGQMWSLACPVEQLPSVSIAIARYQKLRQLLDRKLYLETRLSQRQKHKT